jgi:hypothetical protein
MRLWHKITQGAILEAVHGLQWLVHYRQLQFLHRTGLLSSCIVVQHQWPPWLTSSGWMSCRAVLLAVHVTTCAGLPGDLTGGWVALGLQDIFSCCLQGHDCRAVAQLYIMSG